jgi:hypothetical protein
VDVSLEGEERRTGQSCTRGQVRRGRRLCALLS